MLLPPFGKHNKREKKMTKPPSRNGGIITNNE